MRLPKREKRLTEWFTALTNLNSIGQKKRQSKSQIKHNITKTSPQKTSLKITFLIIFPKILHQFRNFLGRISKEVNNGIWRKGKFLMSLLREQRYWNGGTTFIRIFSNGIMTILYLQLQINKFFITLWATLIKESIKSTYGPGSEEWESMRLNAVQFKNLLQQLMKVELSKFMITSNKNL